MFDLIRVFYQMDELHFYMYYKRLLIHLCTRLLVDVNGTHEATWLHRADVCFTVPTI